MEPQRKSERDKTRRRHKRSKRPGDKGESRKECLRFWEGGM